MIQKYCCHSIISHCVCLSKYTKINPNTVDARIEYNILPLKFVIDTLYFSHLLFLTCVKNWKKWKIHSYFKKRTENQHYHAAVNWIRLRRMERKFCGRYMWLFAKLYFAPLCFLWDAFFWYTYFFLDFYNAWRKKIF